MSLQFIFDRNLSPLLPRVADFLHASLSTTEDVRRLMEQEQFLHSLWSGGPLPSVLDASMMRHVLDIGCGAGTWLQSMASFYPSLYLSGIDRDEAAIEAARVLNAFNSRVRLQVRNLACGEIGNYVVAGYDLVHVRFMAGEMTPRQYATLLREAVCSCRPGGQVMVCELELPLSDSNALTHLMRLWQLVLEHEKRAFTSQIPNQLGIVPWVQQTLRSANCHPVHEEMFYAQCAYGGEGYLHFCRSLEQMMQRLRPLLLRSGSISMAELEGLECEVRREVASPKFYGLCPVHVLIWQRGPVQVH
ncbi:class I SAM-dependent methyltransferase [Ktedonospora formicarum]|uniref:Methyltransferase domain-containing protein n=1 Tax=Ktedonospora formicarum TaxID=2778364 RepID=A0A8J3I2K3_9CHLR|nr:class I SAM-dependent methyltransferase [Ktedonospora formicarum]GHO45082.1 hypothetical protein KSX_32450 [Ktedonospora formicarum]